MSDFNNSDFNNSDFNNSDFNNRVVFKKLFAKNFRSINNIGLSLTYDAGSLLVTSLENGAGKSTLHVTALYYVLFDKAYGKGDKKTSLINSTSNKDCLVEVELSANGNDYIIRRGMKPAVFEIYENGVKIEDPAKLSMYQNNISSILGFDEKVFSNYVVLGKDKFVPFIELSAADRRYYGEQMLNIGIISTMVENHKRNVNKNKLDLDGLRRTESDFNHDLKRVEGLLSLQMLNDSNRKEELTQKYRTQLEEIKAEKIKLDDWKVRKAECQSKLDTHIEECNKKAELKTKLDGVTDLFNKVNADIEAINTSGMHCSSCNQPLPESEKKAALEALETRKAKIVGVMQIATDNYNNFEVIDSINKEMLMMANDSLGDDIRFAEANIAALLRVANVTKQELHNLDQKDNSAEHRLYIDKVKKDIEDLRVDIDKAVETEKAHEVVTMMLKDDGVKADIVDMVMPYLNERINHYLTEMNMFITVKVTNQFELEMFCPTRKGQTLSSLSTGQQRRIDLAVMLAWRDICNKTAKIDCNLLILDEILENLSEVGVTDFVEMMNNKDNPLCLHVITQRRSEFMSLFDDVVTYMLKDGSTEIYTE